MKGLKFILFFILIISLVLLISCAESGGRGDGVLLPELIYDVQVVPEVPAINENESDKPADSQKDEEEDKQEDEQEDDEPIDPVEAEIMQILDSMTLYEKICQMLIVTLDSITGVSGATIAGELTKEALEKYPVGGIVHFAPNIKSSEQITLLNSDLQEISKLPLFIAIDEEGGSVARLRSTIGAHSVRAMLNYESGGIEKAFENSEIISKALQTHGFNTNFAPVADVWSNPSNRVIGNRAFSRDFESASELVAAAVLGYKENNIINSLKHFPGHGNTREDSHHSTAYVNRTLDQLREYEFLPFISGIAAGADMVMTGHLIVPELDELPATLSKAILTDILRQELGFEGVIITDSLAMGAITRHFDASYIAVTAINAGVDILLIPKNAEESTAAILEAVETGIISESRITESVTRILRLKITAGLLH